MLDNFRDWYQSNQPNLTKLSREALAKTAFIAGETHKNLKVLNFKDKEIKHYNLKQHLVFNNEGGFDLFENRAVNELPTVDDLQDELNELNAINITDWVLLSINHPLIIEFSAGNILDFSELSGEKDSALKVEYSFLGIIKYSQYAIEICEVIINESA